MEREPATSTERSRATVARRIEAGVCTDCGGAEPAPGLLYCETCRAASKAQWAARRHRAHTVCPICEGRHFRKTCPEAPIGDGRGDGLTRCHGGCGGMLWVDPTKAGDTVARHQCPEAKTDPHARRGEATHAEGNGGRG